MSLFSGVGILGVLPNSESLKKYLPTTGRKALHSPALFSVASQFQNPFRPLSHFKQFLITKQANKHITAIAGTDDPS